MPRSTQRAVRGQHRAWWYIAGLLLVIVPSGPDCLARANDCAAGAGTELEDLLNTTVVSASRHPQRIIDSPRSISVVTAEDLRERNCRTVPEALTEVAGVFLQESNYGGGAPIIRGMIGNRILILVDGIRLNNSTYRLGPNQYLNTIDITQVERIEVIRGTRSVLYGSDALGGLINIITRSPEPVSSGAPVQARFEGRFSNADRSAWGRTSLNYYRRRVGFLGGGTAKNFGNLRAGEPAGRQTATGYREVDGDLKLTYAISPQQTLIAAAQRVFQDDVPRTDVMRTGRNGEPPSELRSLWEPEQRDLVYAEYRHNALGTVISQLVATVSYQDQLEEQERILASAPGTQRNEHNEVKTSGACVQLGSDLGARHSLTYGAEYYHDRVISRRTDVDLATRGETVTHGRVADGARYWSGAAFVQDEYRPVDRLALNLGLRYNQFALHATSRHKKTGSVPISSKPHAFIGSANASFQLAGDLYLMGGVGQGFRAPNVDDVTVLGTFANGFEVPSEHLRPEEAVSWELGLKRQGRGLSGLVFGFLGQYRNLIDRGPGLFDGLPFLDANHDGIQQANEESVYQRENIGRARIYGLETEGSGRLSEAANLFGNFTWTFGEDTRDNHPLTRVPPLNGTVGIRVHPSPGRTFELYTGFAAKQTRLSSADRADRRIGAHGTAAWATLNVRGSVALGPSVFISLLFGNILDADYRLHGSGLDAPGRNVLAGARVTI